MKSIRIATASLVLLGGAPASAQSFNMNDMMVQGAVQGIVGMTTGDTYGSRVASDYPEPGYVTRSQSYSNNMTRRYYYERYGRLKVQACANDRRCSVMLDNVARSRSQYEMDLFFAGL